MIYQAQVITIKGLLSEKERHSLFKEDQMLSTMMYQVQAPTIMIM